MLTAARRLIVAGCLLLALAPPAVADELTLAFSAGTRRPGDLVVATVTTATAASDVTVTVFERSFTAFATSAAATTWRALVGIDLAQAPGRYDVHVTATTASGTRELSQALVVTTRTFRTRRLSVAPDYVNPPPDVAERIATEQQFIQGLYAQSAPTRLWTGSFVRPVPGAANSSFGTRSVFNGEARNPHAGTDFLSGTGTPIKAPAGGRIVAARDLFFTGNTVIIDHGLGLFSMLAHMSQLKVREGDVVAAGTVVGLVGATGRVTGPHLHWSLLVSGARVDPLSALALLGPPVKR